VPQKGDRTVRGPQLPGLDRQLEPSPEETLADDRDADVRKRTSGLAWHEGPQSSGVGQGFRAGDLQRRAGGA
jgi:hypothetical protein